MKPGFSEKTVICLKGQGNQQANSKASDLIIKFKQLEHAEFKRKGDNLILTKTISLADSLNMTPTSFTSLDGRKVAISCDETISPSTVKVVGNEGMPTANKTGRGSLYIKFDIIFPTAIDTDCLNLMLSALKSNEIELEMQ